MIPSTNIVIDADSAQESPDVQPEKKTALSDQGLKKKSFKEVLDMKLAETESEQLSVEGYCDDHKEDKVALLDLATQTLIRQTKPKPKPLIANKVDAILLEVETVTDRESAELDETADDVPAAVTYETVQVIIKEKQQAKFSDKDSHAPIKAFPKETNEKKSKEQIKPDQINPHAQPLTSFQAATAVETKIIHDTTKIRQVMLQLAEQMCKRIERVQAPDRTDTTLTLQHPPLFAGVEVRITEFKTSQNQFNVTFVGVTDPTARMLIEMPKHQAVLQQTLIDKGYILQTITIEQTILGQSSTEEGEVAQDETER